MYGFNITKKTQRSEKNEMHCKNEICFEDFVCSNLMISKFQDDKIFSETDRYIVILDGVILNKMDLTKKTSNDSWLETVLSLYENNDETFFLDFRGSFAGALYDKIKKKWIIFSDHIGSKFIYYSHTSEFFTCSLMISNVYETLNRNKITYHLSTENSLLLLTYGFMLEDRTLCKEIKKIQPGCYIVFENNIITEKRYYVIDNTPNASISEKDSVELIDYYFRQAVKNQFEKDNEYGYKHLVALSAGLDSRMTSWVADDMGYTNQLNFTFSQTNYWDEIIPKKIAMDLKHEWIFKALDNGLWLYDVDDITYSTGGNVLYYGTAHGNSLIKYLNFNNLGLIHSGQIGDVIIGSGVKREKDKYEFGDGAYSLKYIKEINFMPQHFYKNKEVALFYYRYFNGTNNGLQNIYNYTETLSPFLDLDLLKNVLSIPIKLRSNHYIYKKWIIAKYPQAANYVWEKIGCKITEPIIRIG